MTWFAMGAAIIAFMLTVNFAVFLFRRGSQSRTASAFRRRLSTDELGVYAAMVTVWVVGFALLNVWPDSRWGHALAQPWALPRLWAWSVFVGIALFSLMLVVRARRSAERY